MMRVVLLLTVRRIFIIDLSFSRYDAHETLRNPDGDVCRCLALPRQNIPKRSVCIMDEQ